MSQVPGRLIYTDSSGNQQVIGSFLPSDPTQGNISTFTIEEDAKNYKRVIIEGAPELYDNLPTTVGEFEGDEPVIIAQEDENQDGSWTDRARVYPEKGGKTNERGKYKNEDLWGFKKYYGEDDVEVTSDTNGPITTNLTDVLDALLPSGYTAQYPSDRTPPNVSNYTFRGSLQKAFNEIRKQYDHFIIFTKDTDGSGDVIVKLQPKGYGGTQFSLVRRQDAYTYNNWEKNDTSNVVSKVKVVGTDSNNNTVERVVAAGSNTGVHGDDDNVDVYLGSPEPDRKRFKSIKVDYTITQTEADNIAERIIDPTATEHGEIEADLNVESTLNQSVGISDDTRTPENPIDDVFTVVKQKDFLHQGSTLYSFEFESEASQEQVDKWREHDSERAKVYPAGDQTVNIDFDEFDPDMDNADPDIEDFTGGALGEENYEYDEVLIGPDAGETQGVTVEAPTLSPFTEKFIAVMNVVLIDEAAAPIDVTLRIQNSDNANIYFEETLTFYTTHSRTIAIIQREEIDGDNINFEIENPSDNSSGFNAIIDATVDSQAQHQHGGTGDPAGTGFAGTMNAAAHGASDSDSPHNLFGEGGPNNDGIIQKLIDQLQELKTDR